MGLCLFMHSPSCVWTPEMGWHFSREKWCIDLPLHCGDAFLPREAQGQVLACLYRESGESQ